MNLRLKNVGAVEREREREREREGSLQTEKLNII